MAGVFVGTFAFIVALSLANGFEQEVRSRITGTLAHAKITLYNGRAMNRAEHDLVARTAISHPRVLGAAPYILGKVGVEYGDLLEYLLVTGIDPALDSTVTTVHRSITSGSYSFDSVMSDKKRRLPGLLIGSGFAEKSGLRPGREVILMSLRLVDGQEEPTPNMVRFVVSGIFETGLYEHDQMLAYISLDAAQQLLSVDGIEGIAIRTADLFKSGRVVAEIKETLGGYPFRSEDWLSQYRYLFDWITMCRSVTAIVISFIFIVSAFNMISSLYMIIQQKRREIGILMGMGSSGKMIMQIFLYNGLLVGIIGSTLGVVFGMLLCFIQAKFQLIHLPAHIYMVDRVPVVIRISDIIIVYLSAIGICFLASWYPSWRASRIMPGESMRFE